MGRQRQQQRRGNQRGASRARRKVRRNVTTGIVHIKSSFNNTIVSVSDQEGNVIAWESAGSLGFKGSRKSTPYAAQMTAESCANKAMDQGVRRVDIEVKGHGSGRDMAARTFQSMGVEVLGIRDVTGQPHNGCRPAPRRRGGCREGRIHGTEGAARPAGGGHALVHAEEPAREEAVPARRAWPGSSEADRGRGGAGRTAAGAEG